MADLLEPFFSSTAYFPRSGDARVEVAGTGRRHTPGNRPDSVQSPGKLPYRWLRVRSAGGMGQSLVGPVRQNALWVPSPVYCRPQRSNAVPAGTGSGVGRKLRGWLLHYAVAALPSGVFRGFDFLAALAAENADEAPHGVLLPARRFHDFRQRHALSALHHRDHVGLLIGARLGGAFLRPSARAFGRLRGLRA